MFLNIKMDEKEMAKGKGKVIILKVPSFSDYPNLSPPYLQSAKLSEIIIRMGCLSCP